MNAGGRDLVSRTVFLCRALRSRGLPVTTGHAIDAVRALRSVGIHHRDRTYWALRCVLASRPEDFGAFDALFWETFAGDRRPHEPRHSQRHASTARPQLSLVGWLGQSAWDDRHQEGQPHEVPAASDRASVSRKDFSAFGDEELPEFERIAARLARRLATRLGRRWTATPRGTRVDLRRTMRGALSSSAEVLELRFRRRKPRRTRIVALCDVSGSMDLYSRFLLKFLHALQRPLARVESFVFSTSVRRVTEALRQRPWSSALRRLSGHEHDWSGGTRIGECLGTFNREWGGLVDRRTVVVILSDGWDTGEPRQLAAALKTLKMRSGRIVWLNPLLGNPGYQPLTQGMRAALPYLNVFAPAHDLASLRALERHLLI
jgi:uncharacterized protein with von Willebrand factor type A (vWA) domain